MSVIEVKNLSFSYTQDVETIKDINFKIDKGSFVSIVGHNGCGKSTLVKLLIGLLTPKKGEIFINGKLLTKNSVNEIRQKMALVFQNPDNQFIGATVEDDIAFGLENKCVPHNHMQAIINEYANEVGMIDYLKKEPSMLSGGQKQRVAIAGALALNPEIIIFDESTSMLDPKGKRDVRELILKMKQNNPNLTVISITHDIEEAYESDTVIVMSEGRIATLGNPKEVLKDKKLMSQVGIEMPFILTLQDKFKKQGIDIPSVDNVDQLVEALWQLK